MTKSPRGDSRYRERVYRLVLKIPAGRVMSYGLIARVLGDGYDPRAIGNIMFATPKDGREIPWHRVINSRGACSTAGLTMPPDLQQKLLEAEGIEFSAGGICKIERYSWAPRGYNPQEKTAPIASGTRSAVKASRK